MMVFNVRPGGRAENSGNIGWVLGVDDNGEVLLNFKYDDPTQDCRLLANGNLMFSQTTAGVIREVTLSGEPVRNWHVSGKWKDKIPPTGSIEIDVHLTHHTINVMPNEHLLLLSAEVRTLENWPASEIDPRSAKEMAQVVGDLILEVDLNGTILNEWKLLDLLDPNRMCYGTRSGYWRSRGFPKSYDWCHTNSVTYDPADDTILASLRTQDCIVKFSRSTGELIWILGDHGNWRPPWSDKLLKPLTGLYWQYHQHDCSVTPTGSILCFDNGNFRTTPPGKGLSPGQNYSRAVEFGVDVNAGTVDQIWEYGSAPHERLFTCYQGGAYRLPTTGNTFITYGGTITEDGMPSADVENGFARARLVEVTPDKEIVFDMWIADDSDDDPLPLSVFRSEFVPII